MNQKVSFAEFGLDRLTVEDHPPEELGPGEVRVKVHAVSLNYRDYMMVMGWYNPKLALPLIPCSDGAGEVLAVGSGVTAFKQGDRVCTTMLPDWQQGLPSNDVLRTTLGGPKDGMLAHERVLPQQALVAVPDHLTYVEAACLPVAGLTAWTALHAGRNPLAGGRVLLLGTGGVSMMALTMARALGAEVVITSGSDEKLARARALGAHHTINYRTHERWDKEVRKRFPNGVDLVLEVGGDGTFDASVKSVRNGGTISLIGVLANCNKAVNLTSLLMRNIRVQGILVGSHADFKKYLEFLAQHRVEIVVDKVFSGLPRAGEAFAYLKSGAHFGKIVIEPGKPE